MNKASSSNPRRGLLVDLDGTLADSLSLFHDVYRTFLNQAGRQGSPDEFDLLNGPKVAEIVQILARRHALTGTQTEYEALYNRLIDEAYDSVTCQAGASELLESAFELGWTIALVTSNSQTRAARWLRSRGLGKFIDHIVSGDLVERGKPAPDIYLKAIEINGCDPAHSLAVEDSPNGARAAISAGLRTFVCAAEPGTASQWPVEAEFVSRLDQLIPFLRHDLTPAA